MDFVPQSGGRGVRLWTHARRGAIQINHNIQFNILSFIYDAPPKRSFGGALQLFVIKPKFVQNRINNVKKRLKHAIHYAILYAILNALAIMHIIGYTVTHKICRMLL